MACGVMSNSATASCCANTPSASSPAKCSATWCAPTHSAAGHSIATCSITWKRACSAKCACRRRAVEMNKWLLTALSLAATNAVAMDGMDSPHPEHNQWMLNAHELEWRDDDGDNITAWSLSGWYGGDINKLTFASEGEAVEGDTESHELRLGL